MRKPSIIIGLSVAILLLVAAGTYSYLSPQLTLKAIRDAAEARDTERLRELVDFDSLKTWLKEDFKAMLASSAALELKNNPFAPLGLALAGVMIDPMVDAIMSPSGIVQMISRGQVDGNALKGLGGGEQVPARNGTESHPGSTAQASEGGPVIVHEGYDGYSRYRVVVRATTGTSEDTLGLTLRREGIFTWRLSRVILPQRFFATHTNDTLPNGASHKWLKITDLKGQEIHTKEGVCFFISGRVDNDSTNPGSF